MDITRVPVHEIDHPELRKAADAHREAKQALRDARRAVERLTSGRTQARQLDAEQRVEAKLTGKATPKGKTAEQKWEDELADAERALVEAEVLTRRTLENLQAAAREHGTAWADQVASEAEKVDDAYQAALRALLTLHDERQRAFNRCRLVCRERPSAGTVRLHPSVCADSVTHQRLELARLDDAGSRFRQRVVVPVADVLQALLVSDQPEVIPPMPGFAMADDLARAFHRAKEIERGFSDEEIATGKVPGTILERPLVSAGGEV
jgi:phage-related minor tail protein